MILFNKIGQRAYFHKLLLLLILGGLGLALLLLSEASFATVTPPPLAPIGTPNKDSSKIGPPSLATSVGGGGCGYFGQDTYGGTELLGSGFTSAYWGGGPGWSNPPLTDGSNNLTLSWSGGATSPLATAVTCAGTYQIFFSLQVQAASNGSAITIYPCVQTTDAATLIYGTCPASAGGTGSFIFNSSCNGGNYCGVVTYPFAATVHLNAGQLVGPPSLHSTAQIAITGGEFTVHYVGP